jgi:hypothetical protein
VLHDSTEEIRRYAGIQRAVEAAGQHIDAGLPFPHARDRAAPWTPEQVRGDGVYVSAVSNLSAGGGA